MDQPLSQITRSVFRDMLETEIRLRQEAEGRLVAARQFLIELASCVAGEWLEQTQLGGTDLNKISLDLLMAVIRQRITTLMVRSSPAPANPVGTDWREQYQKLNASYQQLEAKNAQLAKEKDSLETQKRQMLKEIETAQEVSARATRLNAHHQNWDILPDFYLAWTKEKFFNRQSALLRLMGETGLARHPELEKQIAETCGLVKGSQSLAEVFNALRERNFIKSYIMDGGLPGQPPGVDELTELGQAAYLFLSGEKAVESEVATGLEDHKTHAHLRLVLKAKDWLKKAGYEILDQPSRFFLEGQRQVNPDIIARRNDATFYIEVERDSRKGNQDRDAKWNNLFEFTNGKLYVFCQNDRTLKTIIREINSALGSERLKHAIVRLCDLDEIDDDLLRAKGDVWTSSR